jgi:hypothetical protein
VAFICDIKVLFGTFFITSFFQQSFRNVRFFFDYRKTPTNGNSPASTSCLIFVRSLTSLTEVNYLPTLPTYSLTHSLTFTHLSLFEQINTRSVKLIVRICLHTFFNEDQLMIYHQTNLWIKNLESVTTWCDVMWCDVIARATMHSPDCNLHV